MQNVVGKLSRTPGTIRHTGPRLGEHNREVLVDLLGFPEDEVGAQGIELGGTPAAAAPAATIAN
jgi:crotonobetainyl-CoA:carnitine CoA-transferase CaiB-like acyl-CoA transferase